MTTELLPGLTLADCQMRHVMPSDRLWSAGLEEANDILAEAGRRPILILGGSHSAYSVAGAFLDCRAPNAWPGQIVILQRRQPRVFYPDRRPRRRPLPVEPGDICPRTQRVNRLGGLRGFGREMWRQIAGARARRPNRGSSPWTCPPQLPASSAR